MVDFRCSFTDLQLERNQASAIHFYPGDKVAFELNLGCGLYVHKGLLPSISGSRTGIEYEDDEEFDDDDGIARKEETPQKVDMWDNFRTFYLAADGHATLDFSQHFVKKLSLWQAGIEELKLETKEIKVFQRGEPLEGHAVTEINDLLQSFSKQLVDSGFKSVFGLLSDFVTLPIFPYPVIEQCLGLEVKQAVMQTGEGFATFGYDYKVKASGGAKCLFNMKR